MHMFPKSSAVYSSVEIASAQASRPASVARSAVPPVGRSPQKRVATHRRMGHSWLKHLDLVP